MRKLFIPILWIFIQIFRLVSSVRIQSQSTLVQSFLESYKYYTPSNITSLTIQSTSGSDAIMKLMVGSSHTLLMALLAETGTFTIRSERVSILEIGTSNNMYSEAKEVRVNSLKILDIMSFKNVNQWKLYAEETFEEEPKGWSNSSISQCGGVALLGGYGKFAGGEVSKRFSELPTHTMVRVVANYYFIDAWQGEMGYMLVDTGRDGKGEFVWSEKHDYTKYLKGTDVCGGKYPENKMNSNIDIVLIHACRRKNKNNFRLDFR